MHRLFFRFVTIQYAWQTDGRTEFSSLSTFLEGPMCETRTYAGILRETRPDAWTGAEKEDVSGETRTYGNPTPMQLLLRIGPGPLALVLMIWVRFIHQTEPVRVKTSPLNEHYNTCGPSCSADRNWTYRIRPIRCCKTDVSLSTLKSVAEINCVSTVLRYQRKLPVCALFSRTVHWKVAVGLDDL